MDDDLARKVLLLLHWWAQSGSDTTTATGHSIIFTSSKLMVMDEILTEKDPLDDIEMGGVDDEEDETVLPLVMLMLVVQIGEGRRG